MKKHNHGFTLVELVVVIVVLGILAVTALPKYLNLQRDARVAAVHGAGAALNDAAKLAYSKAAIDGVEILKRSQPNNRPEVPFSKTNLGELELKYGYPEAHGENGGIGIIQLTEFGGVIPESGASDDADWDICYVANDGDCFPTGRGGNTEVRVGFGILENPDRLCRASYIEPDDDLPFANQYQIIIETQDC